MSFFIASTWDLEPPRDLGKSVLQVDSYDPIKREVDDKRAELNQQKPEDQNILLPYNVFQTKKPKHTSTEKNKIVELK